MGDRIGVCVIGSGRAGMIHARNFRAGVPGAELIAIADPVESARRDAAAVLGLDTTYPGYREALDDERIGAVIVVAPTVHHRDIVVAAARAGRHVLCEKPMAMNAGECREMMAAAGEAGVKLQVGFMRRFDSGFRDAFSRIQGGEIGAVNQVKSLTHGPSVPKEWMLDIGKSNGPLAEVCSHDIDTLRWFGGANVREVYAIAHNFRCTDKADSFPDFYDTVAMLCSLENGVQGVIDGAVSVGYGYDARAEVLGSDGVITVGHLQGAGSTVYGRDGEMRSGTVKSWRNLFREAYWNEDVAFIEAIIADRDPEVTGLDGLQAVLVVNAGNESIRTGKPVLVGG